MLTLLTLGFVNGAVSSVHQVEERIIRPTVEGLAPTSTGSCETLRQCQLEFQCVSVHECAGVSVCGENRTVL